MKFALLILIPFLSQAQKLPDAGEILADSSFICRDWLQPDSEVFDVKEICNTENHIEIRLKTSIMATTELIILSFDKDEWFAEKHYPEYITKRRKVLSTILMKKTIQDSTGHFTRLFDSLRSNNLFLLPDQRKLKERLVISDGVLYTITYKVGDRYRRYWYGGPVANAEYYPKVAEYKQVIEIVRLLNDIF